MKIQAIIMAGGVGSRLRPLTDDTPKPMVKIIDKPVLETIIERLKYFGIYDIGLTVNYKSDVIKNYFSNGRRFGVRLTYFEEEKPLGTAGSVKQAEKYLSDNFFVASGDAYSEVDYDALYKAHVGKNLLGTLLVKRVSDARGFGLVKIRNGVVEDFIEKPQVPTKGYVNTGIYALKRDILQFIPDGFYDFGRDLFPRLINNLAAFEISGYWNDIGTLERYYESNLYAVKKLKEQNDIAFF